MRRSDPSCSDPGPELSEGQYKLDGAVATLGDGRVVIDGGQRVEVYDPGTREMTVLSAPPVPPGSFISASTLWADTVLVAGGYDSTFSPTADARVIRIPAVNEVTAHAPPATVHER